MTPDAVSELRTRVQNRSALYCSRGMDPILVEALLDDVNRALIEFQGILAVLQARVERGG